MRRLWCASSVKKLKLNKKGLQVRSVSTNAFQSLSRSIISQQISVAAAASIYKRFTSLWPRKKFPHPRDIISAPEELLRSAGLSRGKIVYLRDLAEKFLDKTIMPSRFPQMSDEEIIEHLVRVKGIGVWTAHMFLIFGLNRPNVLPVGDLAIRKGFQVAFRLKSVPTEKRMRELARAHEGEHTALSLHLWGLIDKEKKKK